ncbi:MAG: site-specific integrase [Chromatiales bacterium]|jgi:integrase|nr:site-specific integrase [Chromatiales bacterium]
MAFIRVRPGKKGVSYRVEIRRRGHPVLSRTFASKTLARQWATQTEAALIKGEVVQNEAHRHTLAEAITRFLQARPDLGRDARSALKWWSDTHGKRLLSAVTPAWLLEVRDGLVGEPKRNPVDGKQYRAGAAVANRRITYLAAVLGKGRKGQAGGAMAWGWLRLNPAAEVGKLPEPKGRVRWLTDEERERLLAACADAPERALLPLVLCALSSGARAGELLALRWKDVSLAEGSAVIHASKTGHGRTLHFVGQALTALKAHAKVRPLAPDARVFASDEAGKYPFQYGAPFRAAVKAAKLKDFKFHDLRHCAASYMAQDGASLLEIGTVLGHKSQQTTARYAHLAADSSKALVARVLGKKLAEGKAGE